MTEDFPGIHFSSELSEKAEELREIFTLNAIILVFLERSSDEQKGQRATTYWRKHDWRGPVAC